VEAPIERRHPLRVAMEARDLAPGSRLAMGKVWATPEPSSG
jgi:hypothetical protein